MQNNLLILSENYIRFLLNWFLSVNTKQILLFVNKLSNDLTAKGTTFINIIPCWQEQISVQVTAGSGCK